MPSQELRRLKSRRLKVKKTQLKKTQVTKTQVKKTQVQLDSTQEASKELRRLTVPSEELRILQDMPSLHISDWKNSAFMKTNKCYLEPRRLKWRFNTVIFKVKKIVEKTGNEKGGSTYKVLFCRSAGKLLYCLQKSSQRVHFL